MSSSIVNGLLTGEEARINKIKPNSGTSVVIQDADGNDRLTVDADGVTIAGTTTTVDVATVTVDDKNVELNAVASPTDANADGGGLTLKGSTDKTIAWTDSTDAWHFNQGINVTSGDVGIGTTTPARSLDVLNADGNPQGRFSYNAGNFLEIGVEDNTGTGIIKASGGKLVLDPTTTQVNGNLGIGLSTPKTKLTVEGAITLKEQAAADSDTAAYGQLWTKTATPNQLYFTTDAGDDIQLTSGTAIVSSGSGDVVAGSTFTTANIIMVCDGDDKTIDEPSATISTNSQALTVGNNTGIRVGDGSELELSVEAGNDVVIRSHGSNNDVHFKVNDGGTNTTVMVLDGGDPAVHIKGGAASAGVLKIFEDSDDGTDAVTITVPALAAAYTLTLPADDGDSGEYLQTNGSGTLSWAAATGTDRMTTTNRFRAGAFSATASTYFTGDVATDAGQWYVGSWSATHGSTVAVDSDWLSGYEVGPQWQAPRACTLTQICATSRINASSNCHSVNIHVFKATPVNNNASTTDIDMTLIGTAALTNDGSTQLTDYALQTINTAISSGNSVSANDVIVIGMQPVGGATAATSYFQVTLEFTVS